MTRLFRLHDTLTTLRPLLLVAVLAPCWPLSVAAQPAEDTGAIVHQARLFVLPDCAFCERARQWLHANSICYDEIDISSDAASMTEFKALGGAGTPLVVIGEEVVHGYDPQRMALLLGLHGE